jgi:hypothetical protein
MFNKQHYLKQIDQVWVDFRTRTREKNFAGIAERAVDVLPSKLKKLLLETLLNEELYMWKNLDKAFVSVMKKNEVLWNRTHAIPIPLKDAVLIYGVAADIGIGSDVQFFSHTDIAYAISTHARKIDNKLLRPVASKKGWHNILGYMHMTYPDLVAQDILTVLWSMADRKTNEIISLEEFQTSPNIADQLAWEVYSQDTNHDLDGTIRKFEGKKRWFIGLSSCFSDLLKKHILWKQLKIPIPGHMSKHLLDQQRHLYVNKVLQWLITIKVKGRTLEYEFNPQQ